MLEELLEIDQIKWNQCLEIGCDKFSSFGYITDTPIFTKNFRYYCGKHKIKGMVNLNNKLCKHKGCNKYPSFCRPKEKTRIYCFEHKKKGMVNNHYRRLCAVKKCKKEAVHKYKKDKTRIYCHKHGREKMISLKFMYKKNKKKIK